METLIDSSRGGLRLRPAVLGLLALVVLTIALGRPPDALAALGSVNVTVEGRGSVTGDGINCPASDCRDQAAWRDDQAAPRVTLTAQASLPGHRIEWEGCLVSGSRPRECTATYSEEGTAVTARFVDTIAPQVSLDGPADGLVVGPSNRLVRLRATASDDDRVARVEFHDGPTLFDTDFAPPWAAADRTIATRPDGPFTLGATAFDAAGNSATATRTAIYDETPPTVTVNGSRERVIGAGTASGEVVWSSTDLHPGSETCLFLRPGATVWTETPCAHPLAVAMPTDGRWGVTVSARDAVGNYGSVAVRFDVDRTPPAVPRVNEGPTEGSVIRTGIRVLFGAPGETGHSWECAIDGVATACPNGLLEATGHEGPVRVTAAVRDAAGNLSGPAVRRFTIDRTDPAVTLTDGPAEGGTVTAGVVPFAWTVSDATATAATCAWDDGTAAPCPGGRAERTLTPGEHRFELRVSDAAGNGRIVQRRFVVRAATPPPGGGNPGGGGSGGDGGQSNPGGGDPAGGNPGGNPPVGGPGGGGSPSGGGASGGGTPSAKRCIVPRIKAGGTPKQARQQLTRAGCRVKTKQVRSAKVRRGRVVRLSRKAATKLPHQTTIVVSVSRGR